MKTKDKTQASTPTAEQIAASLEEKAQAMLQLAKILRGETS